MPVENSAMKIMENMIGKEKKKKSKENASNKHETSVVVNHKVVIVASPRSASPRFASQTRFSSIPSIPYILYLLA